MYIVDSHCHAGDGDGLTGPWDTSAKLDRYLVRAARAKIQHTVLFSAFHSDYAVANARVAHWIARCPERFSGYALVNAARDRGRVHALVQVAVTRYGFCGLKVHRHDARLSREICAAAETFSLPVLYDPMGEIGPVELVAEAYPRVPFIIPHLGSFADDWAAQRALIDVLARRRNVFADTSGVRRFDLLVEAVERAGANKVLFGSDGPWLHPGVELAKVHALRLGPDAERAILGGNWLRLTARARARAEHRALNGAPPNALDVVLRTPRRSASFAPHAVTVSAVAPSAAAVARDP